MYRITSTQGTRVPRGGDSGPLNKMHRRTVQIFSLMVESAQNVGSEGKILRVVSKSRIQNFRSKHPGNVKFLQPDFVSTNPPLPTKLFVACAKSIVLSVCALQHFFKFLNQSTCFLFYQNYKISRSEFLVLG